MRASILLSTFLLVSVTPDAGAETPVYTVGPSTEFFQDWLLCGPFPLEPQSAGDPEVDHLVGFETDFLESCGGETNADVSEGRVVAHNGIEFPWVLHHSEDSIVDLDEAISTKNGVAAYGYCEIESSEDTIRLLAFGSNDGSRVWLNGEVILDHPGARGLEPDDDIVPVRLREGRNRLLLKVEERANLWGFCARLLPFEAASFADRVPLFRVVAHEDGNTVLRFEQPTWLAEFLLEEARIEVTREGNPSSILWQGEWTGQKELALEIDPKSYGRYVVHVSGTQKDGGDWGMRTHFVAGKRTVHTLFEKGKTDYSIVLGKDASESEKWAAEEFQHWLKEVGGADFPLKGDTGFPSGPEIVVGKNKRSAFLLKGKERQFEDNDDSFVYRNAGPSILIQGGSQRGTMYGVMSFLEREMGCRWYTPAVTIAPKKERFEFTGLSHSESPGIRVRNDFYYEAFEPIWAARNRVNGAMGHREQPGGVEAYWAVHTFYPLMPPAEFFEEHPEYYSLIDGERIHDRAQLCLTNPDVLRIMTERVKKTMREKPNYLIYSVSQNDWRQPCQCDKCQAIALREESEAGPVIEFVNRIAKAVEEEFPEKFIGTLAYQYTRKPCKTIRPRDNVVVRLCSIECCFAHDFKSCPENRSFLEDLQGWKAIAPHLYIWDYVVNFSHYTMPYPNFRVLQSNIQTFRDHNAIGIMEQAAYQSRGGEFAELRAYLISKLLWDPECNVEDVIDDFMYGYYGRSGQYVRRYFDLLHDRLTEDTHIHLGLKPDDRLFSDRFVREAETLFDEAEKIADNEEIRKRVEVARLPVLYLKCLRSPSEAKHDGTYGRFCEIVEREGITLYAERGAPHKEAFHRRMEAAK